MCGTETSIVARRTWGAWRRRRCARRRTASGPVAGRATGRCRGWGWCRSWGACPWRCAMICYVTYLSSPLLTLVLLESTVCGWCPLCVVVLRGAALRCCGAAVAGGWARGCSGGPTLQPALHTRTPPRHTLPRTCTCVRACVRVRAGGVPRAVRVARALCAGQQRVGRSTGALRRGPRRGAGPARGQRQQVAAEGKGVRARAARAGARCALLCCAVLLGVLAQQCAGGAAGGGF